MKDLLLQLFQLYFELFQYDVEVFSNPWNYYLLCIPAVLYLVFFFIKWTVLTAPFWLPVSFVMGKFNIVKVVAKVADNE